MPTSDGELTAAEVAQIAAFLQAQAQVRAQLTATAVAAASGPLRAFTRFFSAAAIDDYITGTLKVVRPAQVRMARVSDAAMARVMTIMAGRRIEPAGAIDVTALRRAITTAQAKTITDNLADGYDYQPNQPTAAAPTTRAARAGQLAPSPTTASATTTRTSAAATVPSEQVYGRIFDATRYRLVARGYTTEQAQRYATNRAAHVAATDVMLADRAQTRETMRARGVQRYRRVIRPYLGSGGPVCGLCIVASDRIYTIEDLLPIHDNCRCGVVPVGSTADPGKTLNDDDLRALYQAAGGTAGRRLKTVRVAITEHGELGPLLTYGNHRRRGITEVATAISPDRDVTARAQLASYETQIQRLRDRADAGENVTRALTWMSDKIDELRNQLGVAATTTAKAS